MSAVLDATFCANKEFPLVPFEHLAPELRHGLASLREDPDFFGVLVPQDPGALRSLKSIDRNTALTWYALQEPACLPAYLAQARDPDGTPVAFRLVLDEILAICTPDGPLTGAAALPALGMRLPAEPVGDDSAVGRISIRALQYAQRLPIQDKQLLSARLYFYDRRPVGPEWSRRLPDVRALARHLGFDDDSPARRALGHRWKEEPPPAGVESWRVLQLRGRGQNGRAAKNNYKLYVSPTVEYAAQALSTLVGLKERHHTFKVPRDLHTLFRPDKIVLYFDDRESLEGAAGSLLRDLDGMPAQPVPFTADAGGDGLLSYGMDPPPDSTSLPGQERESWRLWVTNRLASALIDARAAGGGVEPWRYAIERLRAQGVDTNWTPLPSLWASQ